MTGDTTICPNCNETVDKLVLPTPLRLNANPKYTGRGVTICFIDSGFYEHPDLAGSQNRISIMVDVTQKRNKGDFQKPGEEAWHGTMTSVACAGNGFMSNGLYRGIASEARLVLIKVMDNNGRITTENIVSALQWVKKHHKKHDIRIVNLSVGDTVTGSYQNSNVDLLAEELIALGIVVVAAVGNDENGVVYPPANSPNVIAVGGMDDGNHLTPANQLYHSTFGYTYDRLSKPEVIAPAVNVAAPILPGTSQQEEAAILFEALQLPDDAIVQYLLSNISKIGIDEGTVRSENIHSIKNAMLHRVRVCKYISAWYMHAEGTSFAAPIVTSVVAQLLEIDPSLTPMDIRNILFSTCKRLEQYPAIRQGFGVIQPRKAVLKCLQKQPAVKRTSPFVNKERKLIELYIQHSCAEEVAVAGSFNNWDANQLLMEPCKGGLWRMELPMLPNGTYKYKFFIDKKTWIEDVDNPYREPDGLNGFNSLLIIEN